jgi:hypothetical protein
MIGRASTGREGDVPVHDAPLGVLVQIAVDSAADFPEIHVLQDKLALTPLSAWGKPYTPPASVPIDPSVDLSKAGSVAAFLANRCKKWQLAHYQWVKSKCTLPS